MVTFLVATIIVLALVALKMIGVNARQRETIMGLKDLYARYRRSKKRVQALKKSNARFLKRQNQLVAEIKEYMKKEKHWNRFTEN